MNIVILAAGMGKRMHSKQPKVLHLLAGQPLLMHVVQTARTLAPGRLMVVVGHGGEMVRQALAAADVQFVEQKEQLGTGHAVMQALPVLDESVPTLVLFGDVPLIREQTLKKLVAIAQRDKLGVLTARLEDPTGYGRIVREQGQITRVVEQKDATEAEKALTEVNTGILICPTPELKRWLATLSNHNAQNEYYLTDLFARAVADKTDIVSVEVDHLWEVLGVNNKSQLAQLERMYQLNRAQALLEAGVTVLDPARIDIRGTLTCGQDVTIDVGCVFEGNVCLGDNVYVGPYSIVKETTVAQGTQVLAYSHIDGATIGANARIGPYARVRPGSMLSNDTHIGNFVEIKNSQLGQGSKANHLAYIGDATIGQTVNIGAGTITCNYDGVNKHRTIIEDGAFIGSDTQLVAPVTVGKGATIGAGTTLVKDAPAEKLTLSRARQLTIEKWQRPLSKKK